MNVLGLVSLLRVKESGDRKKAKHSERCFKFHDVLQTFYTITRRRQGYHRCCIILLGLSIFFLLGPFLGEYSVLYLFVRMKFGWTAETFGYFAGVKMIVLFFGTPVIVRILSLYLKVSDACIGILACILQMIPSLIYPFVQEGWIMYIVALTEVTHGTAFTVQKAIVTKLVSKEEMGQVNSFMCFTEALVPIVMIPLYNLLYQNTIHKFPGAFFLFNAAITVPAVGIFIVVYFLLKEKQSLDITNPEISFRKEGDNIQCNETGSTSIRVKPLK
ncbi:probable peptidoglycan muropeptide transporter SLC46 [Anabrus simplex]|uniref:probable peptidoglycan muropeptide transporter SLC46 n=1 Tax=Anabrus simplex TaxID=316456 RepID=UPI0035A316D7